MTCLSPGKWGVRMLLDRETADQAGPCYYRRASNGLVFGALNCGFHALFWNAQTRDVSGIATEFILRRGVAAGSGAAMGSGGGQFRNRK